MRKSFIFGGVIAALIGITSCSSEIDEPVANGEGSVQFTVQLPAGIATRAFNDGTKATSLSYAVYDKDDATHTPIITSVREVTFDNLTATVELQLANGKSYNVIFWADNAAVDATTGKLTSPYTFDAAAQTVTVDYAGVNSSDDNRDAFYNMKTIEVKGAPVNEKVELRRPFAQINLGTNDLDAPAIVKEYGEGDALTLEVAMTAKTATATVPNTLNLTDGSVSGETTVSFGASKATIATKNGNDFPYQPTDPEAKKYGYISMDYILVGNTAQTLLDLTYTFYNGTKEMATLPVTNVPVRANYQTNIYGSLLTSPATLQVEIKPAFGATPDDQDINVDEMIVVKTDADGKKYVEIQNQAMLDKLDKGITDGKYADLSEIRLADTFKWETPFANPSFGAKFIYKSMEIPVYWNKTTGPGIDATTADLLTNTSKAWNDGVYLKNTNIWLTSNGNYDMKGKDFKPFDDIQGTFYLQSASIHNLTINMPDEDNVGFIRKFTNKGHTHGLIKIYSATITGRNNVGIIVGLNEANNGYARGDGSSRVQNVYAYSSTVKGVENVGAICGKNDADLSIYRVKLGEGKDTPVKVYAYNNAGLICGNNQGTSAITSNNTNNQIRGNLVEQYLPGGMSKPDPSNFGILVGLGNAIPYGGNASTISDNTVTTLQ